MELHFTPEQEAQICRIAQLEGKTPEELIADIVFQVTDQDTFFRQGVQRGLDQADAGEFVDEKKMEARLQAMMRG